MNEERLNELERLAKTCKDKSAKLEADGTIRLNVKDISELIAAARERNELAAKVPYLEQKFEDHVEEIKQLEAERDALKDKLDIVEEELQDCKATKETTKYIDENLATLRANNAALRDALGRVQDRLSRTPMSDPESTVGGIIQKALASTPADSLTEYRNGVLEEAAKEAEKLKTPTGYKMAEAIRAMKTNRLDTMTDEDIIQDVRDNNDTN